MWHITPLDVGTLMVTRSTQIARHGAKFDVGKIVAQPCIVWLLTDLETKRHILVDAGPCEDTGWASMHHNKFLRSSEQTLSSVLGKHGLRCEDIDTVILTHLHWDHAYGALELPNAKLYVQSKELRYAVAPLPNDLKVYENKLGEDIPYFLKMYRQYVFLDGDLTFDDGLEIITLPGHSPGSQGVVVDTEQGKVIIAGDLISVKEGWDLRLPSGLFTSAEDCYRSFEKMAKYHALVVGSHDYASFDLLKE